MSWFAGAFGPEASVYDERIEAECPDALFSYRTENVSLCAGGISATSHYFKSDDSGAVICGVAVDDRTFAILDRNDWLERIPRPQLREGLSGQFVTLRIDKNRCELATDALGAREIYYALIRETLLFATRQDVLARIAELRELDLEGMSTTWLLSSHFGSCSFVKGVKRVGRGGRVSFSKRGLQAHNALWTPTPSTDSLESTLIRAVAGISSSTESGESGSTIAIALSGGLDSRVMLSVIDGLKLPKRGYTLGGPQENDVRIALRLSTEINGDIRNIEYPQLIGKDLLAVLADYAAQVPVVRPASGGVLSLLTSGMSSERHLVLDGVFGELARRKMFNRLGLFGRKAIARNDARLALPLLRYRRPPIFTKENLVAMEHSATQHLQREFDRMPAVSEIGYANWLDLLAVRNRVTYTNPPEQARVDSCYPSISPFLFTPVLDAIFSSPAMARASGGLMKQIILRQSPGLSRYPLVAGDDTLYPFKMPDLLRTAMATVRRRLASIIPDAKSARVESARDLTLKSIRDQVMELVHSDAVTHAGIYDVKFVGEATRKYYAGELAYGEAVDWFLSVELFRQAVSR